MDSEIDKLVSDLGIARADVDELTAKIKELKAQMAETELGKTIDIQDTLLKMSKQRRDAIDADLRAEILRRFEEDGDKCIHPALGVKEYDHIVVTDYVAALQYCILHLHDCLQLNVSLYMEAAKVLDLPFVTVGKKPSATIAGNLKEWIREH